MVAAQKSSKKRSAPAQSSGPKSKKPHLETVPKKPAEKQRSRPVTKPLAARSEDSEQEDDEDDPDAWTDDVDEEMEDDVVEDDEMQLDIAEGAGTSSKNPNPNAARESHKAQKVLQDQRKAAKPHSDLLAEAKRVWSLARQKNKIPPAERQKHVKDLMDIIRGKVKDIVFKHDASRIVQTVVKYGSQKDRDEVAQELKGCFKELAQSKYSKFLVTKLIRLCPAHRASILQEFQTHVIRLLLHREASSVLADAFELYANAYERTILLREFYGKEASLFTVTKGSDAEKEYAKKGLSGVLEGADPERRRRILTAVQENLITIFNNSDKGAITHAIVHRALWEYLAAIKTGSEEEQEKQRRDIFESCQEILAEMVHTKDGSRVVREFLAYGSAKDRKQILKILKPHIERMCIDDEAQMVLFTSLDIVDDTKLLAKSVVSPITSCASKLYSSSQGRRSILYLLVPRCRRHFTPAQISLLAESDEIRSRTSKKDATSREAEVLKAASEDLIKWIEKDGSKLVQEPSGSLVTAEIMLYADGDKTKAGEAILKALVPSTPTSENIIDLPPTSRLYKTLLQGGHYNHNTGSIDRAPASSWDTAAFAEQFLTIIGCEHTTQMCVGSGNGAFVVAELCEALVRGSSANGRKTLKSWFSDKIKADVESGEAKGKKILLEKLASL